MVLMSLMCLLLSGCSDRTVSVDELGELQEFQDARVVVDPEVRDVGSGQARTGVATRGSERLDFAVFVGERTPVTMPIAGRSYELSTGCAGAGFYVAGRRPRDVAAAVENAVYNRLAPDAYCEG